MSEKDNYNSSKIRVLKGLEPVKLRPGMYTRTENPNHIIYEIIDNAQDEALAGYANKISVTVKDKVVTVSDNGRGIPVDKMPEQDNKSAAEVIFTELHSGGKFDKESGGAYSFSGGLHGVGISVTNALSNSLIAVIKKLVKFTKYRLLMATFLKISRLLENVIRKILELLFQQNQTLNILKMAQLILNN